MTTPLDKTKYVADWTAKHPLSPRQDTAALARRKLPAAPGSSSPDIAAESIDSTSNDVQQVLANSELTSKSNDRPFERYRNLSMQKRTTKIKMQESVQSDVTRQLNCRETDTKRNDLNKPNLRMSSNISSSSSAPNSARSGSSESSGYHSRQDVGRFSTRRKPVSLSSLSKAPSRSNSSLTSHEAEFQAWKRRKEYKPSNSAAR